ncbi:hypothetical protein GCM10009738_39770 [Kitasatospora viridis]
MTQEQLAELAGLGVRTVQRLETGKPTDARLATVKQAAHALADCLGRDRDEVWRELLAAHDDSGPSAAVDAAPSAPGGGAPSPAAAPVVQAAPVALAGPRGPLAGGDLARTAESLARNLHGRWLREEERRRIHDPFPLPVRWRSAPADLLDHQDGGDAAAAGAGLDRIADVHRQVPSGRLVVLGRAGSGKTVVVIRFVLDYLAARTGDDPVPVIFSIGSWDPTATALRDWLVDRLLRDHPNLAARALDGSTLAAALVDTGWILPVLDGFDEIAAGLHEAALSELNETSLPLLLTSRTEQFATATRTHLLRKAAGIELADLTTGDLAHYLPRTARPEAPDGGTSTVWDPVLDELRHRPDSAASTRLTAVLRTPLMVLLARTRYSDTPGQDPAVLLDAARFPTPHALEEHLLAGFVPTVYRPRPPDRSDAGSGRPPRRWDARRARRYLGHLARVDHQDLAWWQLCDILPLRTRMLVIVLACTVGVTLCLAVPGAVVSALSAADLIGLRTSLRIGLTAAGPLTGLVLALAYGFAVTLGKVSFAPSRSLLRLPGRGRPVGGAPAHRLRTVAFTGLLLGGTTGALYGSAGTLLHAFVQPKVHGVPIRTSVVEPLVSDTLLYGVVYALTSCLALGLMSALQAPVDLDRAAAPADLLAVNRSVVTHQALVVAPVLTATLTVGLHVRGWLGMPMTDWQYLDMAANIGLTATLCYSLVFTAWGQWLIFVRIWLPLTGRLPWATVAFLDDAHRRGVLRQVGAVHQFRHARLQHHLAEPG